MADCYSSFRLYGIDTYTDSDSVDFIFELECRNTFKDSQLIHKYKFKVENENNKIVIRSLII